MDLNPEKTVFPSQPRVHWGLSSTCGRGHLYNTLCRSGSIRKMPCNLKTKIFFQLVKKHVNQVNWGFLLLKIIRSTLRLPSAQPDMASHFWKWDVARHLASPACTGGFRSRGDDFLTWTFSVRRNVLLLTFKIRSLQCWRNVPTRGKSSR